MIVDTVNANILTDERKNRRNVFNEEYYSQFLPSGNFIWARNLNNSKKSNETMWRSQKIISMSRSFTFCRKVSLVDCEYPLKKNWIFAEISDNLPFAWKLHEKRDWKIILKNKWRKWKKKDPILSWTVPRKTKCEGLYLTVQKRKWPKLRRKI